MLVCLVCLSDDSLAASAATAPCSLVVYCLVCDDSPPVSAVTVVFCLVCVDDSPDAPAATAPCSLVVSCLLCVDDFLVVLQASSSPCSPVMFCLGLVTVVLYYRSF